MNKQQVTLLVFLDLRAAYDTIDHSVFLGRLETKFGFTGTALEWFKSYLSGRFQQVVIDDATSDKFNMDFGVPQGSCLGPLLFSIYTTPLFDIVSNHLPTVHCYVDHGAPRKQGLKFVRVENLHVAFHVSCCICI